MPPSRRQCTLIAMKPLAPVLRILLKLTVLIAITGVGLILVSMLLPLLFPVALLIGLLAVLRACWRLLTPRPHCCGECSSRG